MFLYHFFSTHWYPRLLKACFYIGQLFSNQPSQLMDVQPVQPNQPNQPTYFTADSSGIITIPLQQASNLGSAQVNPVGILKKIVQIIWFNYRDTIGPMVKTNRHNHVFVLMSRLSPDLS